MKTFLFRFLFCFFIFVISTSAQRYESPQSKTITRASSFTSDIAPRLDSLKSSRNDTVPHRLKREKHIRRSIVPGISGVISLFSAGIIALFAMLLNTAKGATLGQMHLAHNLYILAGTIGVVGFGLLITCIVLFIIGYVIYKKNPEKYKGKLWFPILILTLIFLITTILVLLISTLLNPALTFMLFTISFISFIIWGIRKIIKMMRLRRWRKEYPFLNWDLKK